jgi:hypothetical protein
MPCSDELIPDPEGMLTPFPEMDLSAELLPMEPLDLGLAAEMSEMGMLPGLEPPPSMALEGPEGEALPEEPLLLEPEPELALEMTLGAEPMPLELGGPELPSLGVASLSEPGAPLEPAVPMGATLEEPALVPEVTVGEGLPDTRTEAARRYRVTTTFEVPYPGG